MVQSCSIFRENRSKGEGGGGSRIKAMSREKGKKGASNPCLAELQQMTSGFVRQKVTKGWDERKPPFTSPISQYGVSECWRTLKLDSCPSQIWYASNYLHTSSNPSCRSQPPVQIGNIKIKQRAAIMVPNSLTHIILVSFRMQKRTKHTIQTTKCINSPHPTPAWWHTPTVMHLGTPKTKT